MSPLKRFLCATALAAAVAALPAVPTPAHHSAPLATGTASTSGMPGCMNCWTLTAQ
jgi:hypothetical protein